MSLNSHPPISSGDSDPSVVTTFRCTGAFASLTTKHSSNKQKTTQRSENHQMHALLAPNGTSSTTNPKRRLLISAAA
ncbi:hypothetical protein TNCV_630151 [Trichonephila clavipes]|nr:hypothetical protein TNCV_630151 [Trichonephila clavipes]